MAKERKQDLGDPEEEALEQRVHDMLDVNAPDTQETEESNTSKKPNRTAISVVHDDSDESLTDAIAETNEQLSHQVTTAPLVGSASKKVTVEEIDPDSVTVIDEPSQEPVAEAESQGEKPEEQLPVEAIDTNQTVGELMQDRSPLDSVLTSAETDKAVSDIIASESDELLAVQDATTTNQEVVTQTKQSGKKPSLVGLIIKSPGFRWTLLLLIVLAASFVGLYPKARYYALNQAGVRSGASIVVTDQSTFQPIKNASVSVSGQTVQTDEEGRATFTDLLLGPSELSIEKRAYAPQKRSVTIGWGSNPFDELNLKPEGIQYSFTVTDVFSNQPVSEVEANLGEFSATANDKGEIKLPVDAIEGEEATVTFTIDGYKRLDYQLKLSSTETIPITITPNKQIAFVSKRAGTFDLYKIDVDGKNETMLLKGTGRESANISVYQHPTNDVAIISSTRDGTYGVDGVLKQNLTLVQFKDSSNKPIASSTEIKAIDWIGNRLVYVMLDDDAASESTSRYKLMSYDYLSGDNRQLATTNYFNSVVSMNGRIYYAPASAYQNGVNIGVFAVHADGSGKDVIIDKEAWNMFRTSNDTITMAVEQEWYKIKAGGTKPEKLAGQPSDMTSRFYTTSPDSKTAIWVDTRDGKGSLVRYVADSNTESVLVTAAGVSGPIRWINDTTFVYRMISARESADYIKSLDNPVPQKIVDVTDTNGIVGWSF